MYYKRFQFQTWSLVGEYPQKTKNSSGVYRNMQTITRKTKQSTNANEIQQNWKFRSFSHWAVKKNDSNNALAAHVSKMHHNIKWEESESTFQREALDQKED